MARSATAPHTQLYVAPQLRHRQRGKVSRIVSVGSLALAGSASRVGLLTRAGGTSTRTRPAPTDPFAAFARSTRSAGGKGLKDEDGVPPAPLLSHMRDQPDDHEQRADNHERPHELDEDGATTASGRRCSTATSRRVCLEGLPLDRSPQHPRSARRRSSLRAFFRSLPSPCSATTGVPLRRRN